MDYIIVLGAGIKGKKVTPLLAGRIERGIELLKYISTEENLQFSKELISGKNPKITLVTTSYHVFRALILARKQGIKCVGFGSKTKWYFTLNALIREFIGYLSLNWKKHVSRIAIVTVFLAILIVMVYSRG